MRFRFPGLFGKRNPGAQAQRGISRGEEEEHMKVIIGLGNPGLKYAGSRHNMGFAVIEELAERHGIRVNTVRQKGMCGSGIIEGEKVLLVKPQTFMNNSGECARPVVDYYHLPLEDVLIVYDDIALPVGQIRVRAKGSAGGHNGMKSLIQHLGSGDFPRVRLGVGAKPPQMDLADYVLGHFPKDELPVIREAVRTGADAAEMWLAEGIDRTMNRFNTAAKKKEETEEEA